MSKLDKAEKESKTKILKDIIHQITNSYLQFKEEPKLVLNENDKESGLQLSMSNPGSIDSFIADISRRNSIFKKAYDYFTQEINDFLEDPSETSEQLNEESNDKLLLYLFNGIKKFRIVSVTLDRDDDENVIFESLNAKFEELKQADLIKNYLFLLLSDETATDSYNNIWKPMEQEILSYKKIIGGSTYNLTDFFRRYLMMAKSKNVHKKHIYNEMKTYLGRKITSSNSNRENVIIDELKTMKAFIKFYTWVFKPDLMLLKGERVGSRSRSKLNRKKTNSFLNFIFNWQFEPGISFLMLLLSKLYNEEISIDQLNSVLVLLESYLVRRHICRIPPKDYFTVMIKTLQHLKKKNIKEQENPPLEALRTAIREGKTQMPTNEIFSNAFSVFEAYGKHKHNVMCKLMLYRMNESLDTKTPILLDPNVSIEHVFPQDSSKWESALDKKLIPGLKIWLNRLGNLTLTVKNSELGYNLFEAKKEIYKNSSFRITRDIAKEDEWLVDQIEKRSKKLLKETMKTWFDDEKCRV